MNLRKKIIWAVVAVCVLVVFFNSFTIIPTGYTGVRVTFGQIDSRTVRNGFNWTIPFVQDIKKVNNKQQDITLYEQIWSETSERTALYFERVTITYQINPEKSSWIYANVSDYTNNLVSQGIVSSATKMSSKTVNSTDVTNRAIIEPIVQKNLQASLDSKYGADVVKINKIVIDNIDFEESYNKAIAEKQNAQLAYERQQIENKKAVEAAEAAALVKTTEAQANADARLIQAQAEAEANRLKDGSITSKILQDKFYDKWDGKLPAVVGSDKTILDISKIIEK